MLKYNVTGYKKCKEDPKETNDRLKIVWGKIKIIVNEVTCY